MILWHTHGGRKSYIASRTQALRHREVCDRGAARDFAHFHGIHDRHEVGLAKQILAEILFCDVIYS